jgi:predicted ArsR family transcriptional regulator
MQHTRQQILDFLKHNRIATAIEMSQALLVTSANVRHHLKLLETAGFVEVVGQRPGRGRGRPMKLYSLTEQALQQNLDGLSSALLQTVLSDTQNPNDKLDQIAFNLVGDFEVANHIHTRLHQAIDHLRQLQYQAAWEASPTGPRLILRNCPYAVILDEHPELCRMDEALLSRLLDQPVQQTAKLERQPDGVPHCAFITLTKVG